MKVFHHLASGKTKIFCQSHKKTAEVIFRRHFAIQEEFGISEVISSKKRESKVSRKKMLARKRIELLTNDLYLDEIKNEKDELILDDGEENEVEKGDIRANPLPEELAFTEKVIVEKSSTYLMESWPHYIWIDKRILKYKPRTPRKISDSQDQKPGLTSDEERELKRLREKEQEWL